jgi:uncharacterized protein YacL
MNAIIEFLQIILLGTIVYLLYKNRKPIKTNVNTKSKSNKLILDSCGLIDGRITELSAAGFVKSDLIVPEFVLKELQLLADGNDSHKRARARFGLDVIKQLQQDDKIDLSINREEFPEVKKTDDKLVLLAKKLGADLYTTDYNLNKVADVEDVKVLNVNELALSLRPPALPGEIKKIKIIQKGSGRGQGVGYLDDGTMVVVENAIKLKDKTISVEIERYHQTESGKMIFAKLAKKS